MNSVKTIVALLFISGLFVFFQNCSVQQNAGILGGKESSSTAADKISSGAPFAYDLAADTISYNSCVGENLNNSGLHGLKIGVNEGFTDSNGTGAVQGGLKLRTEFLQYVGQNLKPRYPSTVITPGQLQSLITSSSKNNDTYIQFAVRRRGDLSVIPDVIQPPGTISLPRDGIVNFSPLFQDPVLSKLTKKIQFGENGLILSEGERIYNLQDDSAPSPIEASFGFSNIVDETFSRQGIVGDLENLGIGERYSETVRNRFNLGTDDKILLTQTYGSASGTGGDYGLNTPRRADDTIKTRAYGRSYALNFGMFRSPSAAGWKNNTLKTVTEYDLSSNSTGIATWSCSSYVIMKQNQWNNAKLDKPSCTPLLASDLANTTIGDAVRKLRRHYLESDWNIGLFYDANQAYVPASRTSQPICLVPKNAECYLPTDGVVVAGTDVGVNYNPLSECYLYNQVGTSYTGATATIRAGGRCAQFASICVRQGGN